MQSTKIKDVWFMNYMKFIGIIYLLIWHTGIRHLNIFVILFFVQLFVFVSGYFYKDIYTDNPLLFVIKRIKSLYIPFVIYCSLFVVLNNVFVNLKVYNPGMVLDYKKMVGQFLLILKLCSTQQMAGAMWFVSSLFITSIIFSMISYILKWIPSRQYEYARFFVIFSLFLLGNYWSISKIRFDPLIDVSCVLLFFFYSGYLYKKHEDKIPMNSFVALSAFALLLFCTRYGFPQIIEREYVNPAFLFACGLGGTYLNIYITKKAADMKKIKFINYIGGNTLAILALHFFAFKFISLLVIYSQNLTMDHLSAFPVIDSVNQYWRWLYVFSGIAIPLVLKQTFDIAFNKGVRLFKALKNR